MQRPGCILHLESLQSLEILVSFWICVAVFIDIANIDNRFPGNQVKFFGLCLLIEGKDNIFCPDFFFQAVFDFMKSGDFG